MLKAQKGCSVLMHLHHTDASRSVKTRLRENNGNAHLTLRYHIKDSDLHVVFILPLLWLLCCVVSIVE